MMGHIHTICGTEPGTGKGQQTNKGALNVSSILKALKKLEKHSVRQDTAQSWPALDTKQTIAKRVKGGWLLNKLVSTLFAAVILVGAGWLILSQKPTWIQKFVSGTPTQQQVSLEASPGDSKTGLTEKASSEKKKSAKYLTSEKAEVSDPRTKEIQMSPPELRRGDKNSAEFSGKQRASATDVSEKISDSEESRNPGNAANRVPRIRPVPKALPEMPSAEIVSQKKSAIPKEKEVRRSEKTGKKVPRKISATKASRHERLPEKQSAKPDLPRKISATKAGSRHERLPEKRSGKPDLPREQMKPGILPEKTAAFVSGSPKDGTDVSEKTGASEIAEKKDGSDVSVSPEDGADIPEETEASEIAEKKDGSDVSGVPEDGDIPEASEPADRESGSDSLAEQPEPRARRVSDSKFKIQALVWSENPGGRWAMINNRVVRLGGSVDGATVSYIGNDYIIFREDGEEVEVEFSVK
ncbi:MAG: hypothetical protein B6245_01570 [Desulfobacteraceae bacterium 4572_88]|nr:MAG: hypothetical protein B6245_01570 [Desulfobacteraceae bacterium 4572_88]